jgi:hypothetical protein
LDLYSQVIKVFSLNDSGTQLGHKSFVTIGETVKQVVGYDGIQNCIAQVFETFIIEVIP